MPSIVIRSIVYRPAEAELEIMFTTGRRYVYSDVPPAVADAFRAARIKGPHFNRHIRGHYRYRECASREDHASSSMSQ
jgi:hypothetical protein